MDIRTFLAYAASLEQEAEEAYLSLVEMMTARGNHDASEFFREMAGFSRLHREDIVKRAGIAGVGDGSGSAASLQGGGETPVLANVNDALDLDAATLLALDAEQRAVAFYEEASRTAPDPGVRALAEEFAAEERQHVAALERFLGIKPY